MTIKKNQRGFTMLIAVVTGTVLLLIAFGMASIALRQQVLSGNAPESQKAFYAADSGLDCALYLDTTKKPFAVRNTEAAAYPWGTSEVSNVIENYCGSDTTPNSIVNRVQYTVGSGGVVTLATSTQKFLITYDNESCALVSVTKSVANGNLRTVIDSRGYNTCKASPNRLERAVQAYYDESHSE